MTTLISSEAFREINEKKLKYIGDKSKQNSEKNILGSRKKYAFIMHIKLCLLSFVARPINQRIKKTYNICS